MLKFALVGCGRIAQRYAKLLQTKIVGAQLVGACDVILERAQKFEAQYKVPVFQNMNDMLGALAVDAVCVLTPSGLHAEHVMHLAPLCQNIIVEKPMALTISDALAMQAACHQSKTRLFVVKQNRLNLPIVKLREVVDQGLLGELNLGTVRVRWNRDQAYYDQDAWRGTWALDGGVLANQASHHIDLLQWFMGDVKSVYMQGKRFLSKIDTEDTAIATIEFTSGALGIIEATTATRPADVEGSLSLLGSEGMVEIGGFAVNQIKEWRLSHFEEPNKAWSENPTDVYGFGHQRYLQKVVETINHNAEPFVSGLDGSKSVSLIAALYESQARDEKIYMDDFEQKESLLGIKK